MHKRTDQLQPGDEVIYHGHIIIIEMVSEDYATGTIHVRHTTNGGWFRRDALWLIQPSIEDALDEVDNILRYRGRPGPVGRALAGTMVT